jgi:hypothetical protein
MITQFKVNNIEYIFFTERQTRQWMPEEFENITLINEIVVL